LCFPLWACAKGIVARVRSEADERSPDPGPRRQESTGKIIPSAGTSRTRDYRVGDVRRLGIDAFSDSIIRIINELAKELDLETVAEGVETEAQAAALSSIGCDSMQGYLYGKPIPQADFRARI